LWPVCVEADSKQTHFQIVLWLPLRHSKVD